MIARAPKLICGNTCTPQDSKIHMWPYVNHYQLFIHVLAKHAAGSLYLVSVNQSFCQAHLGWPFCHMTGTWLLDEE